MLVSGKHRATCTTLIYATFGDEDCIVVSLSEDESGENDIYYIELDAQQSHDSKYPYPAYCHRDKGNDCQLQLAERVPQKEEYYCRTNYAYIVKIRGEAICNTAIESPYVKRLGQATLHLCHLGSWDIDLVYDISQTSRGILIMIVLKDSGGERLKIPVLLLLILCIENISKGHKGLRPESILRSSLV